MAAIHIDAQSDDLTRDIESAISHFLGAVSFQTDFRRGVEGVADASIFVKGRVSAEQSAAMVLEFDACGAIESVRFAKQKLSLRFTESFVAHRLKHHETASKPSGKHRGKKVVVGFCDPNANKALHLGHLRNIALGSAISSLWRSLGASVERQCVVCDIGRNIAEALAGLEAAGPDTLFDHNKKLAPRLGDLYADYVAKTQVPETPVAEADAPVSRELHRRNDQADIILDRWRAGDNTIRALWAKTIERVTREQRDTLKRLGIQMEQVIYESASIGEESDLIERLMALGLVVHEDDRGHVLNTGRADYAKCPLTRSDEFPTEHLRALVLWEHIVNQKNQPDLFVHVMGQEWRTSTEIRLDTLKALHQTDFPDRYQILAHEMVRLNGSDMKSSTGQVILLDDLLDSLGARLSGTDLGGDSDFSELMVRVAAMTPFLETPVEATLDTSIDRLLDPNRNPGLQLAQAITTTRNAKDISSITPELRFLTFQGDRLSRVIETATLRSDPALLVRFLLRLAIPRLDFEGVKETDAILHRLLLRGCAALGWSE